MLAVLILLLLLTLLRGAWRLVQLWRSLPRRNADFGLV